MAQLSMDSGIRNTAETIELNENIQEYATEFAPQILKIMNFIQQMNDFSTNELSFYEGASKSEFENYMPAFLNQLQVLGDNYSILMNNLLEIVIAFLQYDSDAEEKINAFITTILEDSGVEVE